ncbi:hypothetical protein B0F90DRAFT_1625867 [Multifurca ochricompacta]|uniref:G-patch domain-containing protein n=1 Tax=Multifurca ochricompacta TaxID=376703 RepID=A0AAD4M839_9AGAM|nr:hypothetical protein B0F90DRAFT_1625867 [Multifurca ochricompacta]
MPLDGHAFLINQGWSGTGTGLRTGAISRPITIPQKRNLNGIGRDRDEAFPFWDHLFTVAASAIQIECFSSDDENAEPAEPFDPKGTRSSTLELRQTSTGILSNRPPIRGTPVSLGATTLISCADVASGSSMPRLSVMALARREAARRGLYSKFLRGPILGPDDAQSEMVKTETSQPSYLSLVQAQVIVEIGARKKNKRKVDLPGDESLDKEVRKRHKKRRNGSEKASRRLERHKKKNDGDEKDTAMAELMNEAISPSHCIQ